MRILKGLLPLLVAVTLFSACQPQPVIPTTKMEGNWKCTQLVDIVIDDVDDILGDTVTTSLLDQLKSEVGADNYDSIMVYAQPIIESLSFQFKGDQMTMKMLVFSVKHPFRLTDHRIIINEPKMPVALGYDYLNAAQDSMKITMDAEAFAYFNAANPMFLIETILDVILANPPAGSNIDPEQLKAWAKALIDELTNGKPEDASFRVYFNMKRQ